MQLIIEMSFIFDLQHVHMYRGMYVSILNPARWSNFIKVLNNLKF